MGGIKCQALELLKSPHAPDLSPVTIHYREFGRGKPLVFLHGGWGYGVYPFDRQIAAFQNEFRILIPDRTGYGCSTRVAGEMPLDFHRRAAAETISFLDALGIERAVLWGHSDGSVISAMAGLAAPERCRAFDFGSLPFSAEKTGVAVLLRAICCPSGRSGRRNEEVARTGPWRRSVANGIAAELHRMVSDCRPGTAAG